VKPEVSSLDYANSLQIQGYTVPDLYPAGGVGDGLADGQSFAIAGLMDNRVTGTIGENSLDRGRPGVLGKLFQSKSFRGAKTSCSWSTPTIVKPLNPGQAPHGPVFHSFLDQIMRANRRSRLK
jgi:pilus assembly protein CpaC